MSSELYERFAQTNKIVRQLWREQEVTEGAEPISLESAMEQLNKKYYG